jgi:hypothetical protein
MRSKLLGCSGDSNGRAVSGVTIPCEMGKNENRDDHVMASQCHATDATDINEDVKTRTRTEPMMRTRYVRSPRGCVGRYENAQEKDGGKLHVEANQGPYIVVEPSRRIMMAMWATPRIVSE